MRTLTPYLILLLTLTACHHGKAITPACYYQVYKVSLNIGFKGFATTDIDTIFVSYYKPDSTFSQLINTDTVITHAVYINNGYEYRDTPKNADAYFAYAANDLVISLPATGSKYFIHAVYTVDSVMGPGGDCSLGRTFVYPPSIFVNGQSLAAGPTSMYDAYIVK